MRLEVKTPDGSYLTTFAYTEKSAALWLLDAVLTAADMNGSAIRNVEVLAVDFRPINERS